MPSTFPDISQVEPGDLDILPEEGKDFEQKDTESISDRGFEVWQTQTDNGEPEMFLVKSSENVLRIEIEELTNQLELQDMQFNPAHFTGYLSEEKLVVSDGINRYALDLRGIFEGEPKLSFEPFTPQNVLENLEEIHFPNIGGIEGQVLHLTRNQMKVDKNGYWLEQNLQIETDPSYHYTDTTISAVPLAEPTVYHLRVDGTIIDVHAFPAYVSGQNNSPRIMPVILGPPFARILTINALDGVIPIGSYRASSLPVNRILPRIQENSQMLLSYSRIHESQQGIRQIVEAYLGGSIEETMQNLPNASDLELQLIFSFLAHTQLGEKLGGIIIRN